MLYFYAYILMKKTKGRSKTLAFKMHSCFLELKNLIRGNVPFVALCQQNAYVFACLP